MHEFTHNFWNRSPRDKEQSFEFWGDVDLDPGLYLHFLGRLPKVDLIV